MCQICGIKDISKQHRWPKPLEHHTKNIEFLVTSAHDEHEKYKAVTEAAQDTLISKAGTKTVKDTSTPGPLIDILCLLATLLEDLEDDRATWWSSPDKRQQRRRLEEECDQMKLSQLHKINNDTTERIEAMNAKLGAFVKWSLGMNGGIWELQQYGKVAKDGKS